MFSPGRAGVVAGRQPIHVDGALGPPAARLVGQAGADVERDREGLSLIAPAVGLGKQRIRLLLLGVDGPAGRRQSAASVASPESAPPRRRRAARSAGCCGRRSPGGARSRRCAPARRTGARSGAAASGTPRPAPGRRIFETPTTSPCSASKTGNSPVSLTSRASRIVSREAEPQPSGQGTKTCR